jgi:hypothetical protein
MSYGATVADAVHQAGIYSMRSADRGKLRALQGRFAVARWKCSLGR